MWDNRDDISRECSAVVKLGYAFSPGNVFNCKLHLQKHAQKCKDFFVYKLTAKRLGQRGKLKLRIKRSRGTLFDPKGN